MGKNQAYKAMQRTRLGSTPAGPEEIDDGMVDGSFHSPEWHAARLASLKTSHMHGYLGRIQKETKEDAFKKGDLEADTDRMMRKYRAQLDAKRARKLAQGRNHSSSKSSKKDKKEKDSKKHSGRKRKHSRRRSSDSSASISSSKSSGSDDEETRESPKDRNPGLRDREKKKKPVPLSRFFECVKS